MEIDEWWGLIEQARAAVGDRADDRNSPDDPLPDALMELLVAREPAEIIGFEQRFTQVWGSAYRYPLWNAAYLIEGGCGDDGFMDFRAGLVLLGRETFTRAVDDPDSLADLPVVRRMAQEDGGWIGCEGMNYLPRDAYAKRVGETDTFDAAIGQPDLPERPAGEDWDAEDDEEMRRRLPRLAALFL
ncbi:hypothetical protein DPM19_31055 [Actinomadura craniellae]|uniref:DUF4240 domain-containing protein n=1 Tax=Actinomadura craniellae TaxID=2231787 RepID=A0A365GWK2_9ACTN|nr:DUF4240 domain-containing protein [Actinomadura craniellae]RAY11200.1 hypothetical protein DPM19_31055 [Actinomadura craniellae]